MPNRMLKYFLLFFFTLVFANAILASNIEDCGDGSTIEVGKFCLTTKNHRVRKLYDGAWLDTSNDGQIWMLPNRNRDFTQKEMATYQQTIDDLQQDEAFSGIARQLECRFASSNLPHKSLIKAADEAGILELLGNQYSDSNRAGLGGVWLTDWKNVPVAIYDLDSKEVSSANSKQAILSQSICARPRRDKRLANIVFDGLKEIVSETDDCAKIIKPFRLLQSIRMELDEELARELVKKIRNKRAYDAEFDNRVSSCQRQAEDKGSSAMGASDS